MQESKQEIIKVVSRVRMAKINRFMPNGLLCLHSLDRSISNIRGVMLVYIITMFYRNSCI